MDLGLKILSILAAAWMTPYFATACICEMLRAACPDFSGLCILGMPQDQTRNNLTLTAQ